MNRKTVFALLLGTVMFSPVEAMSQNIFQKAAETVSSWFSGSSKKEAAQVAEHIDIRQLTLDENLSIPDLGNQDRKIRSVQSREMKRLQKPVFRG